MKTNTFKYVVLPTTLLLILFASIWTIIGPGVSQNFVKVILQAKGEVQPQTWTDPTDVPKNQPSTGTIILNGYGTLNWKCSSRNPDLLEYTFIPINLNNKPWTWKDAGIARRNANESGCLKSGWDSLRTALQTLHNDINRLDTNFFHLIDTWWEQLP